MMSTRNRRLEQRELIPPYGPTSGTIQALQLLGRTTPPRIDSHFLRVNNIAPANEYKVVGALRFLGLIDDDDKPTESCRLLKTRGATYTLALQDIVINAYAGILHNSNYKEITKENIYNYFVTQHGMGAEMATKATRFLIKLCQLAKLDVTADTPQPPSPSKKKHRSRQTIPAQQQPEAVLRDGSLVDLSAFPLVLALTRETASMDVNELTDLIRKTRTALEQSLVGTH